jgi:hypothetical protein
MSLIDEQGFQVFVFWVGLRAREENLASGLLVFSD